MRDVLAAALEIIGAAAVLFAAYVTAPALALALVGAVVAFVGYRLERR